MKKINFLLAFLMIICINNFTSAQITFQKTFGDYGWDQGNSIQQTSDGGYIITGFVQISGVGYHVYLIKTDYNGQTLWTKTYGFTPNDWGKSVKQTTDGGYIIAGASYSGPGGSNVYLIKTTANGDTLWTKIFGGTFDDVGNSVQQTSDGGYIIAGKTSSFGAGGYDVYLIKTNSYGDTMWTKTYGGTSHDEGNSVKQTTDGGYIIGGTTNSFGPGAANVYLIKTTANGDTLWTKTYGGTMLNVGRSVQQTSDGGYIIAGWTDSFGAGNHDVYLIKTTVYGDFLWTKTYGGTRKDEGYSVQQTSDGGYIITGRTTILASGMGDVYLIKTTANGDTIWTKYFGETNWDIGNSGQQTTDGGYIVIGQSQCFGPGTYDVYLIKTDANGNSGCNQGNTETFTSNPATQQAASPTIVSTAATQVSNPISMVGSAGTITSLCTSVGISELSCNSENINIFPNPAQDKLNIILQTNSNAAFIKIYNIYGAIVSEGLIKKDVTIISISEFADGLYLYQITDSNSNILDTGKFMKE